MRKNIFNLDGRQWTRLLSSLISGLFIFTIYKSQSNAPSTRENELKISFGEWHHLIENVELCDGRSAHELNVFSDGKSAVTTDER